MISIRRLVALTSLSKRFVLPRAIDMGRETLLSYVTVLMLQGLRERRDEDDNKDLFNPWKLLHIIIINVNCESKGKAYNSLHSQIAAP